MQARARHGWARLGGLATSSRFARALAWLVLVSFVFDATAASAQGRRRRRRAAAETAETSDTERARALFTEGVSLVAASQYADAEARFRQALALRDAPAIRYNLASVLYEQGEYPEANLENERALAAADVPEAVRSAATELRAHLAERAGYARFELTGAATGGTLAIDGFVITDPSLEVPLSPATHTVVVTIGGAEVARREVELATGERRTVVVGETAPDTTAATETGGGSIDREEWFWPVVAGGGVLVLVIVGVGVGVAATSGVEGPVEGNFTPGVIRW